jgi:phosphatidylglycerol:prolipoprotein diacylglycerol transferase
VQAERLARPLLSRAMLPQTRFVVGATQVVVSLHALAIVLGVGAGGWLAARRAAEPALALVAVAAVAVVALVGAHALFALVHGAAPGGLASTGGIAGGLATTWVVARLARRPAAALFDALAPAGLLALAIGRVGCFLAGCCYGRPTTLPWGVVFADLGPSPRHPLQLYSAAADLALVALLPARVPVPGVVACRALAGFGVVRAALELLRDRGATDPVLGDTITLAQAAALALAVGAVAVGRRLRPPAAIDYASARRIPPHGR